MNIELEKILNKLKENIKKYKIIENVIIFTSLISANFVAYIAYFDINMFMFIDSSAVIKHTFSMIILFTFVSASLRIFFIIFQNIFLVKHENILFISFITLKDPDSSIIYKLFDNRLLRYIITIIIFNFLYIGITNTLYVLVIFFLIFSLIFIIDLLKEYSIIPADKEEEILNEIEKIKFYDKLPNSFKKILKNAYIYDYIVMKEFTILHKNGKYFKIILSKLGIILITISLLIGIGKANFIEKNNLATIILNDDNNTYLHILFLTTKNGVCAYNKTKKYVEFIPWENIKKIIFLSENPYSIHRLIPQNNKDIKHNNLPKLKKVIIP